MSPLNTFNYFTDPILHAFASSLEVTIGVVDMEGKLVAANAGAAESAGCPLSELIGTYLWDVVFRPEDEPMIRQTLAALAAGAPAATVDSHWRRGNGSLRIMRWVNLPMRDDEGVVRWVIGMGREATVHEALRICALEAEQHVRLLVKPVDELFYIADVVNGRMTYASPGVECRWECSGNDLRTDVRRFLDRVHPDDRPAMDRARDQQLHGQRTEEEYRLLFPDGRIRWIRDRSYPIFGSAGEILMVAGIASDVTAHREAMERLADREQLLSAVFNRSSQALWLLSPDGKVLEFNDAAVAISSPVGIAYFQELSWASAGDHEQAQALQRLAMRGECARYDVSLRSSDGRRLVLDLSMQPVHAPAGEIRYLLAEALDITQRVRERQVRDEAEQRLALAIEATSEGVWDWNLRDSSAFYSPRWCRNLGYVPSDVSPTVQAWYALVHPDDCERACEAVRALIEGRIEALRLEVRLRKADGDWFWSLTRGRIVQQDARGQPLRAVGTDTDIGHLKQVEERIRSLNESLKERVRDRTAALEEASRATDEFLAVMSHELRTPLMGILGVAESISEGIYGTVTTSQVDALGLLNTSAQQLLALIGDVLDLAKIDAGRLPVSLHPTSVLMIVREAESLIRTMLVPRGQLLQITIPRETGLFDVDALLVRQVLLNILTNAGKCSPHGAQISLEIESDARIVTFRVSDQGAPIREQDLSRIFRPFQQLDMQLAGRYGGVGLGLALVHRLTSLHGGGVTVIANPAGGNTFQISFPRAREWPLPEPKEAGSVLVVAASGPRRVQLENWLRAAGFTVSAAADLTEALARLEFSTTDVLLVDGEAAPMELVAMPKLRHLRVVIMMAVTTAAWRDALVEVFSSHAVLEVPLEPARLLEAIAAVRQSPPTTP
ncbi:PAS domain-containing protein [Gemmatimonas sp.]|uniref:PAS domain-containing protein n=1 Tax=Gemmatimonas sp. TaxID=1962908 RepID=UPI003565E4B9